MKSDKIKNFVQENYKLIIPISLMVVLFISFFVYYKISVSNDYKVDEEKEVYQYFYGEKYEYDAIISKDKKNVVVDFKPKNVEVNLDSTPIYYKNEEVVLFPKDMSVVMPTLSCAEYSSLGYSYITFEKGMFNLTTKNYHDRLNHYFLYDGTNLFFFIEPVTLYVKDKEVKLSSYSYVIAKYNGSISYYDKKTDTFNTFDDGDNNARIKNDYYNVYISKDTIDYQGASVILTSGFEHLNTIDKKGK